MANFGTKEIKELRERTGAGMLDCKNALIECDGSIDKAIKYLREKGITKAAKKAGRIASEGTIGSYIHGGRIGVMVEVNSETDFVAKNEEFLTFARDIAMHIAANSPLYISKDDVPEDVINKEREVLTSQALNEGKPEAVVQKMVEGRLRKYYSEICLLEQPFLKDLDITVGELLTQKIAKIGENLNIRRFHRYELGEGIEKKEEDFAAEVAAQMG